MVMLDGEEESLELLEAIDATTRCLPKSKANTEPSKAKGKGYDELQPLKP